MQTFLPYKNPIDTAKVLDYKRLGKQRSETIQILNKLLCPSDKKGRIHHPAVLMWKGYESYLLKVYLRSIMDEWVRRGYKNIKSEESYNRLYQYVKNIEPIEPHWFKDDKFFLSHKSNLVRKSPEYYKPIFGVSGDLPYIWPI